MNFHTKIAILATLACLSTSANASNLVNQWKQGLSGAKLTAYQGSAISSNSTLTVIDFCQNGRYRYTKEGSWSQAGYAAGASNRTIYGRWNVRQSGSSTMLTYITDQNEKGSFHLYLQQNGRVNIGGTAYAVQRGGAGC